MLEGSFGADSKNILGSGQDPPSQQKLLQRRKDLQNPLSSEFGGFSLENVGGGEFRLNPCFGVAQTVFLVNRGP